MNGYIDIFTHHETNDNESFDELLYPHVVGEITRLRQRLSRFKDVQRATIMISLLKGQDIKKEWLNGNKEFAAFLTADFFPMPHLKALFGSSKRNVKFMKDLETYITAKFG